MTMMTNSHKLTRVEMLETLSSFTDCYTYVLEKRTATQKDEINMFLEQTCLMVPCYSLRPDMTRSLNDNIFNSNVITQFIFDLSFRFFSLTGNSDDFVQKLVEKLREGLAIDGYNVRESIIPESIAKSCPTNVFKDFNDRNYKHSFFKRAKAPDDISSFLINNKQIILLYLMYLTNQ